MVLAPRPWRYVGGNYPAGNGGKKGRSPGRSRISRKAIARGKPGCLGCTCQIRVHSFHQFSTRRCGCIRRPAFPAPSMQRGPTNLAKLEQKRAARAIAPAQPHRSKSCAATARSLQSSAVLKLEIVRRQWPSMKAVDRRPVRRKPGVKKGGILVSLWLRDGNDCSVAATDIQHLSGNRGGRTKRRFLATPLHEIIV